MKKFKWLLVGILVASLVLGSISIALAGNTSETGQGIFGKIFGRGFKDGTRIGVMDDKIAGFLGITVSDLVSARKEGKSLATIATEHGKTEDELINYIVSEEKANLDSLLSQGKITQAQYDNITSNLNDRVKEMVEKTETGKPFIGKGLDLSEIQDKIANFLGVTVDDLKTARDSGKSLVDIASDNGRTEEELVTFIYGEAKNKLDSLLSEGKITQTQHDNMVTNLKDRIKKMVEATGTGHPFLEKMKDVYRKGFKNGFRIGVVDDKIAGFLGITVSDLVSARKEGKSLATIATEHGKTEDELINYIVSEEKANLDSLLSQGKITQAQYDNITSNLNDRVKEMVEKTNIGLPGFGKGVGGKRP